MCSRTASVTSRDSEYDASTVFMPATVARARARNDPGI